jgi:hypothetical protein
VREVDGVLRQLVVSKLDATWCGPWEYSGNDGDWKQTIGSLERNLNANDIQLEGDGEFPRVV